MLGFSQVEGVEHENIYFFLERKKHKRNLVINKHGGLLENPEVFPLLEPHWNNLSQIWGTCKVLGDYNKRGVSRNEVRGKNTNGLVGYVRKLRSYIKGNNFKKKNSTDGLCQIFLAVVWRTEEGREVQGVRRNFFDVSIQRN